MFHYRFLPGILKILEGEIMKVIDLFAGAGGLSEGFRQAGFDVCSHIEIDASAAMTLKVREAYYYLRENHQLQTYKDYLLKRISRDDLFNHVPEEILNRVINIGISDNTIQNIFQRIDDLLQGNPVSMIIGGPPCQAYSVAGRSRDPNRMKDDPRNFLYKQYIKFLVKYQPNYFVFENVMGMLSAHGGEIFANIRNEIRAAGYEMDFKVLNSSDFGVLQNRKRVIIIGWRSVIDFRYPDFHVEKSNYTIRDLFNDLPSINAGEKHEVGDYYVVENGCALDCNIRNTRWDVLSQHDARPQRDQDLEIYELCVEALMRENKNVKYNELPARLITHKDSENFLDRFKVVPYDGISHTVVAHIAKDGHHYIHPDVNQNRSLSIREAARIQSFPDDYYFETSRTAAFKQIGNAVPPLMAKKIALKFRDLEQI
jgi:DNA (cytosine-5)-methyltransferase 1